MSGRLGSFHRALHQMTMRSFPNHNILGLLTQDPKGPKKVAGSGYEAEFVADEIVEHDAGVATDGTVRFVRDNQVEICR